MNIGLLISGNLGYRSLHFLFRHKGIHTSFVLTDKNSESIINFCKTGNIPIYKGNPRKNSNEIQAFFNNKSVDYIFSINYLFIIGKQILEHPEKYCINFHGSLLPKYRGRTPHVWAIINGEKETGITAHIMDKGCDTGPIIKQVVIPIEYWDTGGSLLDKFNDKYLEVLNNVITDIQNKHLKIQEQDHQKATYFGKRNPEDGEINWNWQKERIRNWIRAQAYPYPGAFCYLNGQKIIIDKITYSDLGYSYDQRNGKILKVNKKPFVKTPNGVVILEKIRYNSGYFTENKQFDLKSNHNEYS